MCGSKRRRFFVPVSQLPPSITSSLQANKPFFAPSVQAAEDLKADMAAQQQRKLGLEATSLREAAKAKSAAGDLARVMDGIQRHNAAQKTASDLATWKRMRGEGEEPLA